MTVLFFSSSVPDQEVQKSKLWVARELADAKGSVPHAAAGINEPRFATHRL
jgi:hypothetical protein